MIYKCCDEYRREALRAQRTLEGVDFNGIDYLEVVDNLTLTIHFVNSLRTERIELLHTPVLDRENVSIAGGERITGMTVRETSIKDSEPYILEVKLDKPGDRSTYTLLLQSDPHLLQLDSQLSAVDFTFPGDGTNTIDCAVELVCQPDLPDTPDIDYLAKDFNSFRQLMLDRLTVLMPRWTERSAADLGVMLVEVLAYVGDHLSYQQDVIATESYLSTARRRISVRRHARLLDYAISEGCNARVWVQIHVNQDMIKRVDDKTAPLPKGTKLLTQIAGRGNALLSTQQYNQIMQSQAQPEVFETMYDVNELFKDHNEMSFYTWGARECCLPKGATSATLYGAFPHLKPGDMLIFKEMFGPHTGMPEDAEPKHRCAVRLTKVTVGTDPLGKYRPDAKTIPASITSIEEVYIKTIDVDKEKITRVEARRFVEGLSKKEMTRVGRQVIQHGHVIEDIPDNHFKPTGISTPHVPHHHQAREKEIEDIIGIMNKSVRVYVYREDMVHIRIQKYFSEKEPDYSENITNIEWHYEDALPFALCISATTDYAHGHQYKENVTIALGNIVLADHGVSMPSEALTTVPQGSTTQSAGTNRCDGQQPVSIPARFNPSLTNAPLTFASPYDASNPPVSACAVVQFSASNALPAITLKDDATQKNLWQPVPDLLNSKATDRHFVVESDNDGAAYLRFGDDQHGSRPPANTTFTASYRVGNGVRGNIGIETIQSIVSDNSSIDGVSNPLPAVGGTEPESIDHVRQQISLAFMTQQRGVTPQDYVDIATRHPQVHRANAILRWTGSWYTALVVVERIKEMPVDEAFKREVRQYMEQFRMAGGDLMIVSPIYVSLEIVMTVNVQDNYFAANVKAALLEIYSNQQWPDGTRGIFYPDTFAFGQPVYLNDLYVAAASVQGIASIKVTIFQRQDIPGDDGLNNGLLTFDWLEVARLDNDPNDPEHGTFLLNVTGGK